jgi:hypothetical protein
MLPAGCEGPAQHQYCNEVPQRHRASHHPVDLGIVLECSATNMVAVARSPDEEVAG